MNNKSIIYCRLYFKCCSYSFFRYPITDAVDVTWNVPDVEAPPILQVIECFPHSLVVPVVSLVVDPAYYTIVSTVATFTPVEFASVIIMLIVYSLPPEIKFLITSIESDNAF